MDHCSVAYRLYRFPKSLPRFIVLIAMLVCGTGSLHAQSNAAPADVHLQLRYAQEEVENEKRQRVTNDPAVQTASGFSLHRARLFFGSQKGNIGGKLSLGLEKGTPMLLDAALSYQVDARMLRIDFGQMIIPSTYEVNRSSFRLDFTSRSRFSTEVANWSLSKSPSSISPFTSVQTYSRDMGLAIKGVYGWFDFFIMTGNGLGANLFVGGDETRQFVYANNAGSYFHGVRLELNLRRIPLMEQSPLTDLTLGGHANVNDHEDILYNDKKTVLDIKRNSWSVDLRLELWNRFRLSGMRGGGVVEDDYDNNREPDYRYSGEEFKLMAVIVPDSLEAGGRYDSFTFENSVFGGKETENVTTVGLSYFPQDRLMIQADYKWKKLDSEINLETDNNIFVLQVQYGF